MERKDGIASIIIRRVFGICSCDGVELNGEMEVDIQLGMGVLRFVLKCGE
jgi:hypothetical protein